MERNQTETEQIVESHSANPRAQLDFSEIMSVARTPGQTDLAEGQKKFDIAKEALKVVSLLDENKAGEAAVALSKDLIRLKGDEYNTLLFSVYASHKNGGGAQMTLEDYNQKTKTWDKVEIKSGSHPEPDIYDYYRIVQPGNTLSQYAVDWLGKTASQKDIREWTKFIAQANKIPNPDRIKVGQAIRTGIFYD